MSEYTDNVNVKVSVIDSIDSSNKENTSGVQDKIND